MREKEKELSQLDENINKAINIKSALMKLCYEKNKNNNNQKAKELIDWVKKHPYEDAETYKQKYDELV